MNYTDSYQVYIIFWQMIANPFITIGGIIWLMIFFKKLTGI
jgi:hypothetical protein